MKRKTVIMLLGIVCLIPSIFAYAENRQKKYDFYPALLQVVSCEGSVESGFQVKLKNSQGFIYSCTWEDGDMDAGDFYTCIMDTQGTLCIYDDTVIQARYTRVDLY